MNIYKQSIVEPKRRRQNPPPRLFARAVVMGYRRNKVNQRLGVSLIKIQGVNRREDAAYYLGKRVAYVYRAPKADVNGKRLRAMWGKIRSCHGAGGTVRACFSKNLPASAIGKEARVFMFPSTV